MKCLRILQKALWNNATVSVMLSIFNIIRAEDIHIVMWETTLYTFSEEAKTSDKREQVNITETYIDYNWSHHMKEGAHEYMSYFVY